VRFTKHAPNPIRRFAAPTRATAARSTGAHTKGSQRGVESLAGEVRRGAALKSAARDLKPNADDDIGRQLHVFYGQSSLGNRLGKVRLEILADALAELRRGLGASDHKPRPDGIADGFVQELREGEGHAPDGIGLIEPGSCQELVKSIGELRTYRGDQLLDALEMIVERPLGDACRLHDRVDREGLRRPVRKKN